MQFQEALGASLRLKARVDEGLKRTLLETPLSADQQFQGESNDVVVATLPDTFQLKWWVLSHGHAIEVMEPPSLRESIMSSLQASLDRYTSGLAQGAA
jgi:predicted DNA-binding transcriptional regulator YafY